MHLSCRLCYCTSHSQNEDCRMVRKIILQEETVRRQKASPRLLLLLTLRKQMTSTVTSLPQRPVLPQETEVLMVIL